jgi:hypothetical protein
MGSLTMTFGNAVLNAGGAVRSPAKPDFVVYIGPDQNANLLKVGVLEDDGDEYVIHAMRARPQYLTVLG